MDRLHRQVFRGARRQITAALISAACLPWVAAQGQSADRLVVNVTEKSPLEQTTAGPIEGYRALTATGATRTETSIWNIPQSIQVITRPLIEDQGSLFVSETLRNISGVQPTSTFQTPAYDSTYIRGFPAEQWLDGITNYYNAGNRDSLVNVERIEVMKGPNAVLYGGGVGTALGGVVNVISKLPVAAPHAEVGITLGSERFAQPYFDVNQPLNTDATVLFRMTGEYTSARSSIDVLDSDLWAVNPTLTFTNKRGTSLTIQGRFSDWRQQEYQGLPATGTITGDFSLPREFFAGPSDIPRSYSKVNSGTVKFDHAFDEAWSFSFQARAGQAQFREIAQNFVGTDFAANTPSAPPSYWNLLNLDLVQKQDEQTYIANVTGRFDAGATRNIVVVGADYSQIKDNGFMYGDLNDLFTLGLVDLANPSFPSYVAPAQTPANSIVDGNNRYTTTGVYAQIQSTVWERLHLVAGVRGANLKIDSISPTYGTSNVTDTTKTLPRIGAVLELAKGWSIYAGYSEGMKGNPYVIYSGTPKPETSWQTEAGVRFDVGNGFSGSMAVYEIKRDGVPVSTGLASEAVGEQRSRGFETDLLWQPDARWRVLANYAYVDAKLLNDVPGGAAGNQLNLVPRNSGRLWVHYRFTPEWSAGAGVYAASGAYVDLANQFRTGGYATADASVRYETAKFLASVSVKNLTGEKYYVPFNYYGGRIAPGEDTGIYAKLAYKF